MAEDFNFKDAKQAKIPLKMIRENSEALRTTVDKESENYLQLVDSVRKRGILNPILVREVRDPATGELLYGLIDGLHRFNACMDAGLEEIPAQIGSLEEGDLLEAQILANIHRIETKPVQYTKALLKILGSNPTLTSAELAGRVSKSDTWLKQRLGLVNLKEDIQKMVDEGAITLTNAYALAQLPHEKQVELVQQAVSKSPTEFCPLANTILKEIQAAKRQGRPAETNKFHPVERLKKMVDIRTERESAMKDPNTSAVIRAAKANNVANIDQAIIYALSWVLHLDPVSMAADEAQWNKDRATREEAAKKRKEEKDAKRNAIGAELAAVVGIPNEAPVAAAAS